MDENVQVNLALLWARAHHEAAHAVVGTLLGGRVLGVEVWRGPPAGGRTGVAGLEQPPDGADGYTLVRRITFLVAGPVAERIAGGGSGAILNDPAAFVSTTLTAWTQEPASAEHGSDLGTVAGLILDFFGADDEGGAAAAIDHLALNVETFVRANWAGIEMVAAALLRHGRLTEEQFHSLLSRALPAAPPDDLLQALPTPR